MDRTLSSAVIPIMGMDCSDCAFVLKHSLEHIDGVVNLDVSFSDQMMRIQYDTQLISRNTIENQIRRLGYHVPKRGILQFIDRNREIILTASAGILLLLGWMGEILEVLSPAQFLPFYAGAYLIAGYPLIRDSIFQIFKQRRFDTDQLMVAAGIGAAILGEFAEGALLLFLFSLGHTLENRALNRARAAIQSLAELVPRVASVRRGSEEQVVPIEAIQIDDLVIVPPGARIPVDGNVLSGSSAVDQSPITGESIPIDVTKSDPVFAGSVNGDGVLEVTTTRLSKDSTLSRIVKLVESAQAKKAPMQRYSDKIINVLVPSILIVDALLIVLPPLFGVPFRSSFMMAMTLLVAASPCALALGTPSAILASIARAARSGILIKGGAHLENLGDLRTIAFDKTGTLTRGEPVVTDLVAIPPSTEDELLSIAAAVEQQSAHPLAEAIVREARIRGLELPDVNSVRSQTGIGITARLDEKTVMIRRIDNDILSGEQSDVLKGEARSLEGQGKTVIQVLIDSRTLGLIALADEIRSDAAQTINALRRLGVQHLVMLSGDNNRVASRIGETLGLDQVMAELMPEEKLDAINELRASKSNVAMVGDGVNDAPALAAASTGIAMGGAKTHVALESSDVVLMADDLSALPFAIELSKRTQNIIRQNFFIALGVIVVLIGLTLANLAGIALAIVIHEGSTLLVVLNALRLLRFQSRT